LIDVLAQEHKPNPRNHPVLQTNQTKTNQRYGNISKIIQEQGGEGKVTKTIKQSSRNQT
jgi:hypothetical protein